METINLSSPLTVGSGLSSAILLALLGESPTSVSAQLTSELLTEVTLQSGAVEIGLVSVLAPTWSSDSRTNPSVQLDSVSAASVTLQSTVELETP